MASTTEFRHCLWITLYMNKVILFFFAFLFGATGSAYAQRFQLDVKAGSAASADIYESLGNLNDPKISSGKLKQHNYDIQAELKLFSIFWVGAGMRGIRFNSNSIDQLSLREIESNGSLDHFEGKFILKPISKDNTDLGLYAGIGFALPANKMIEVASEIIQYGSVKKSWIGDFRVKIKRFVLNNKATYGLEIVELNSYGPLFNDGKIKPGAIILLVNDKLPSWENLTYALNNSFPGDEISFQILQDSNIQNFTVVTEGVPDQ